MPDDDERLRSGEDVRDLIDRVGGEGGARFPGGWHAAKCVAMQAARKDAARLSSG